MANHAFIEVSRIGVCNDAGKARGFIGYKGKQIADAKRPLSSLLIPLLRDLLNVIDYKDAAHLEEDLRTLLECLSRVRLAGESE